MRCWLFALLALLAAAAGCATGSDETEGETSAAVSEDQCLIARYTGANTHRPSSSFFGGEVLARGGERVSVMALEVNGADDFDVLIVGAGERAGATGSLGTVKLAELVSKVDASYHFEVHDRQGRARGFRATIDVLRDRPDCLNFRRICYRAIGGQCEGISVLAPATYLPDGRRKLFVSVGSQLHDTCCLARSDGAFCTSATRRRDLNPFVADAVCAAEWNRAWYDTTNAAFWPHVFDPTQFEYSVRPCARATGSYGYLTWDIATGAPTDASWVPPTDARIDRSDAQDWCKNGAGGWGGLFYTFCK
jgi:hypothetical protein